jgi:hypothetical protein
MPINLHQCDKICYGCIRGYSAKHKLKKGDQFKINCTGIPTDYLTEALIAEVQSDKDTAMAMLDPVTWAAKFLDWHCLDPEGEVWKRKTEDGTLPPEARQYDSALAKQGKSIFHRPYQAAMLGCTAKWKTFRCGRQIGKTSALVISMLFHIFTRNNFRVEVICPYQTQVEEVYDRLTEFIDSNSLLLNSTARRVKAPAYQIKLYNGSHIKLFTAGTRSGQDAGQTRGQCLAGGTEIRLATGEKKKVEDIVTGDQVLSFDDDWKSVVAPVTHVFPPERKELFLLTTRTDRRIKASGDHRFFNRSGEVVLKSLRVGDFIAIPRATKHNPEGSDQLRDIEFDEVLSIECLGMQDCYDVEVASTKKLVANNIVVHNSCHMLVFDEADMLAPADINASLAAILNFPEATVWMSSTPTGKREAFYRTCQDPLWKEFYYPSQANPNWNEKLEEFFRSQLTEEGYNHEITALFGEQEEGVYKAKYVEVAQEEYEYSQMKPSRGWLYMIGVDWNDFKVGITYIVVGMSPEDGKFYIVDKQVLAQSESTQLAGCQKLIDMNRLWQPAYIYVDDGYGKVQVEVLHKFGADATADKKRGPKSVDARLATIVKAYSFGGTIESRDLFTKQKIKKPAKPFLVENSVRRFETCSIKYPKSDEKMTEALLGYIVKRVSQAGVPIYEQQNTQAGDHFLDALNLALVAFTLEKTEFGRPTYDLTVAFSGRLGENNIQKSVPTRESQRPKTGRTKGIAQQMSLLGEENRVPASNSTVETGGVKLWRWPGFGHDAPKPKVRTLQQAYADAEKRTKVGIGFKSTAPRPTRKKF